MPYSLQTTSQVRYGAIHTKYDTGVINGQFDDSGIITLPTLKSGTRVEGFKKKIEAHTDASSDYSLDSYSLIVKEGNVKIAYTINGFPNRPFVEEFSGVLAAPGGILTHGLTYGDAEKASARAKLYSKLQSKDTKLLGLAFLAELPKTVKLLREPASSFRKGVDGYLALLEKAKRRVLTERDIAKRRKLWVEAVSGTYLEWVFGVMPLWYDINGIIDACWTTYNRTMPPSRQTARRVFSSNTDVLIPTGLWVHAASEWYLYHSSRRETTQTEMRVQYSVGLDIRQILAQKSLDRLRELAGFRPDRFIPSLYEVMPWSWVIDYFTNLGDIISAGTYIGPSVRWINESVTTRTTKNITVLAPTWQAMSSTLNGNNRTLTSYNGFSYGESWYTRTTSTRTVLRDLPTIPPIVTHPGTSVKKWLNLAAVAAQQASSRNASWLSRKGG